MVTGFITQEKFILGKSLPELELLLGFHSGRLKEGAKIYVLTQLPQPNQFELRGYSQVAGHQWEKKFPQGTNLDENKIKEFLIKNVFTTIGNNRLVKIKAISNHIISFSDDDQYPPGLGIPQWKLITPLMVREVALLNGNDRYLYIP